MPYICPKSFDVLQEDPKDEKLEQGEASCDIWAEDGDLVEVPHASGRPLACSMEETKSLSQVDIQHIMPVPFQPLPVGVLVLQMCAGIGYCAQISLLLVLALLIAEQQTCESPAAGVLLSNAWHFQLLRLSCMHA